MIEDYVKSEMWKEKQKREKVGETENIDKKEGGNKTQGIEGDSIYDLLKH